MLPVLRRVDWGLVAGMTLAAFFIAGVGSFSVTTAWYYHPVGAAIGLSFWIAVLAAVTALPVAYLLLAVEEDVGWSEFFFAWWLGGFFGGTVPYLGPRIDTFPRHHQSN